MPMLMRLQTNKNMTTTQDKTRHTSGPWEVSMLDTVRGPNGEFIADCERTPHCDRPAPPEPECMANARLIASAPELLAAVCQIRDYLQTLAGEVQIPSSLYLQGKRAMDAAESALAKAEGRDA